MRIKFYSKITNSIRHINTINKTLNIKQRHEILILTLLNRKNNIDSFEP